jgi:protein ImuB
MDRPASQPPLVVSRPEDNALRIAALDPHAERLGLKHGMGLADARAMHPGIDVVEADPAADRRLMEGIADWCDRYTPLVALEGENGLFLDISGSAHLFGGEKRLLADMLSRLFQQGLQARAGLASTPGAAWAAARFASGAVVPAGEEAELVAPMPLAALRLPQPTCEGLESVGLRRVGAIIGAPRGPLARRFGRTLLLRLDQALGHVEEAVSPRLPVPPLSVERHFFEPIAAIEDVERVTALLAATLKGDLERRGEGARALELLLFRVDGARLRIGARTSRPLRDPRLMQKLFRERFAALDGRLDTGCGFDLVRLSAVATARLEETQGDLAGAESGSEALSVFVDRVRARLGEAALLGPVLAESHVPERAAALRPLGGGLPAAGPVCEAERPVRLFAEPEAVEVAASELPEGPPASFRWRHAAYRVARAEGPERIGPEWWLHAMPQVSGQDEAGNERDGEELDRLRRLALAAQTAGLTRDYFRVEDGDGRRYWLYRQGFHGMAQPPRWFMHGLSA